MRGDTQARTAGNRCNRKSQETVSSRAPPPLPPQISPTLRSRCSEARRFLQDSLKYKAHSAARLQIMPFHAHHFSFLTPKTTVVFLKFVEYFQCHSGQAGD